MSNVVEIESNFMADAPGLEWRGPYYLQLRVEKGKVLVTQSCLTLCNPMDCNTPGSSVHGILQARILSAFSLSRGSSWPRDRTWVSCVSSIVGRFVTIWATREAAASQGTKILPATRWDRKKKRNEEAWAISHHCLSTSNPEIQESGQLTLQSSGEF